jgi:hypothetical protein
MVPAIAPESVIGEAGLGAGLSRGVGSGSRSVPGSGRGPRGVPASAWSVAGGRTGAGCTAGRILGNAVADAGPNSASTRANQVAAA